jgi:hypothetical protein
MQLLELSKMFFFKVELFEGCRTVIFHPKSDNLARAIFSKCQCFDFDFIRFPHRHLRILHQDLDRLIAVEPFS